MAPKLKVTALSPSLKGEKEGVTGLLENDGVIEDMVLIW